LRPNNLGGYDRLTLRQLLNGQGDIIEKVFAGMGQNMAFYFRLVLTEKLGMNLRNDFAHGFGKRNFLQEMCQTDFSCYDMFIACEKAGRK